MSSLVLAGDVQCVRCGQIIQEGEPWDLGHFDDGSPGWAGPEHAKCNRGAPSRLRRPRPWQPQPKLERQPERDGLHAMDPVWDVPWLRGLRRVPKTATWPRLMTVPHPKAVDSLGKEFVRWAEARTGQRLRWWQRLVATRLLEVDAKGRLCWGTMILTVARQVGKSWLLRELILWRIHQGERFGEPQDVMHTGKDVAIVKEIQQRARAWAREQPELYSVREANGQEQIEYRPDGSRWLVRARDAVYGYSASVGAVDEAWKVRASSVEEGLTPTMVERQQPQLWLVSTAHRLATSLMLTRRRVALGELESGAGNLLIEWSAPASMEIDDVEAWRLASPHWTKQREKSVGEQLEVLRAGELDDDDEDDPEQFFRSQWLNQWPQKRSDPSGDVDDLLPPGQWADLAEPLLVSDAPIWVAVEDDFGLGAAVAAAVVHDDGRIELDGWLCHDWDSALADVRRLGSSRQIRQLLVGASMLNRVPPGTAPPAQPAGSRETRPGLALFRDLAANGRLVHDEQTVELDQALNMAQVKEQPSGLYLTSRGPTHLVRAAVWAVNAAHRPARMPAIG